MTDHPIPGRYPSGIEDDRYHLRTLDTGAGSIPFGEWDGAGTPVLAVHGISSQHLLWSWTAEAAPDAHLLAPDIRGRGASAHAPGPYGIDRHASDVIALLDALGLNSVVLVGMSMGGFVAVAVSERVPDRVASLLLVDGGPPMAVPAATRGDAPLADRFARTAATFPTPQAYRDLFVSGVGATLDPQDPLLERYLAYDLEETADGLTVRLAGDALRQDAADIFASGEPEARFLNLTVPVTLLCAEWSVGVGSAPAYPDAAVERWRQKMPQLRTERITGVDHAGTVMTRRGAAVVAAAIEHAVAS